MRQVLKALGRTAQGQRPPQKFSAEQLRPPRILRKAYFCGEGDGGGGAARAAGCGRRAAYAVSSDLLGLTLPEPHPARDRGASPTTAKFKQFNTAYFENTLRVPEPIEASGEAVNDHREIRKSIGEPGALAEAQRCFKCGTCTLCGNCRIFCPDRAICYDDPSGKFKVLYDYCKGCGVCAEECPQAALHMRDADAGSTR
ncbi:MAG: 4Fe-4S binding protein [Elusimicrobia bacterium]|nr:4Fe-4S binding protein [Elusimicrobiota bacterium]